MTRLSRKELYAIFLQSNWWINLSRLKRRLVGHCQRCPSRKHLQSHHIRYPENWFDNQLSDLEVLCRDCHEKEHNLSRSKLTVNNRKQRHEFRTLRAKLLKARKNRHRGAFK